MDRFNWDEENYKTFFNLIDQGVFIIDIIFDENNMPVDMYYAEANEAATKILGLDYTGKRLREINPDYENYWFDIFGNVALTGQSVRMEQYAQPDNKWFSFYIFRIGDEKSRRIGNIFLDITQRKKAEEDLRESEQLYRTIFNNSEDGYILVQPIIDEFGNSDNYLMVDVNEAWAKQTGLKAVDLIGKTIRESLPEVESNWPLTFARVMKSGLSEHFESYNSHSDSWYDLFAFPYQKNQVGVLFRDITERKKAEEELAVAYKQIQSIIDNTPDIVYALDLEERFVIMNNAVAQLFHTTPEKLIGKRRHEFMPVEDAHWHESNDRKVIIEKRAMEFEEYSQLEDRSITWLTKKFPLTDTHGDIYAVAGISTDISERKRAEEALRQSEERFRVAQEFSPDGFTILKPVRDANGQIIDFIWVYENAAIAKVNGTDPKTVVGKRLLELFPAHQGTSFLKSYMHVAETGETLIFEDEFSPDNMTKMIYFRVVVVRMDVDIAILAQDFTESKLAEMALMESEKKAQALVAILETADKNKNEFLSALSHELRNPLATIVAGLSLLDLSDDKKQKSQAQEIIKRQTDQLCNLVEDLLDLTRITRNKIELKKEKVDINELASLTLADHKMLFEGKEINLEAEINEEVLYIDADSVRMKQLIGNLLHNAMKFTNAGGTVNLSVFRDKNEVVICVKDNGIGIAPAMLPKIFQPFIQADNSIDRKNGGLGLGLSIVKEIAELHGGRACAYSEGLGKGAQFCIHLPFVKENS